MNSVLVTMFKFFAVKGCHTTKLDNLLEECYVISWRENRC